jgi:DNA-binding response OmpR family regulator
MGLEQAGHTVTEAVDGKAALRCLEGSVFDLVITDVVMPEGDGMEVLNAIRRLRPSPPVVAMSGGGHIAPEHYLHMATVLGAGATLAKPFPVSQLVATVARLLVRRA